MSTAGDAQSAAMSPTSPWRDACARCGHIVPSNELRDVGNGHRECKSRQRCDGYVRKFGRKESDR